MSPSMWLIAILALSGPATYGIMAVKEKVHIYYAVKEARLDEQAKARQQIATLESKQKGASDNTVADATTGAAGIGPTPIEKAALIDLCKSDRRCRDRKDLK